MRRVLILSILALVLNGCVTITKEYISEVPVDRQVEVPIKETVVKVKYKQENVFAQQNDVVEVALLRIQLANSTAETILSSIYRYVTTIPDLNSKYIIYDESTLKTLFGMNEIDLNSASDIAKLAHNNIDYILYVSDINTLGTKFNLNIIDLEDVDRKSVIEFKNSYNSTFLNDLKYFLLQQEIPIYYEEEIITGYTYKNETVMEPRTITHDFKTIPWGGRILLALSVIGVIYILGQS
ncbi:MAG: hypothetical protein JXR56_08335 [Candidatus Cloacimonetes bacterium]|nr:hypothetical protein [Candidatus Cloacimonadota bacterium]